MKTKIAKSSKPASVRLPLRIRSILVPLDFSPSSQQALNYAVTFARQFKARLTLLSILTPIAACLAILCEAMPVPPHPRGSYSSR